MFDYDSDYDYDDNECYIDLDSINEVLSNNNNDNQKCAQEEANNHDDAFSQTNSVSSQCFTLYIANIITAKDSDGNAYTGIDEQFLANLFESEEISVSPESIQVISKTNFRGNPYTYALVKLDTKEKAMNLIQKCNFVKFDNVPIYIFLIDENTGRTLNSNQGCILVKNIDIEFEASSIFDTFSEYGEVIYCHIPYYITNSYPSIEKRTYCYVQFLHPEDAMNTIETLKGAKIDNRAIELQPFYRHTNQRNIETYQKCFIKNFPENYKNEDLKNLFSEFGAPISCRVIFEKNGKSKQIGLCRMLTHEEAVKAVEGLNGKKIENFEIACTPALSSAEFAFKSSRKEIIKLRSFIEEMKEIQQNLLIYLEDEEMSDEKDREFIEFLNRHHIEDDKFKSFLHLISIIGNNHHRNQFFFTKIFQILKLVKVKIKETYSNKDLYVLFHKNKRILLFLIQEQIFNINEYVDDYLQRRNWLYSYKCYFSPDVKKFMDDVYMPTDMNEFDEKRKIGENDAYICQLIRNDNIIDFIVYINKNSIQLNSLIEISIFDTNRFLTKKKSSLIEYSAFFGSFQIFNYLFQNGIELAPSLWLYAVHGMNPEIICFLEDHKVEFPVKEKTELEEEQSSTFNLECVKESIKCHHNDIANYILNLMTIDDDQSEFNKIVSEYGSKYYNYAFLPSDLDNYSFLDLALKHDNLTILQFLLEDEGINLFVKKVSNLKSYYIL